MGQKVHPYGFRLGVNKTWSSNWCARRGFSNLLLEDIRLRQYIKRTLAHAGISRVEVERSANRVRVNIHTARPGIIIGKKGSSALAIEPPQTDLLGLRFQKECFSFTCIS